MIALHDDLVSVTCGRCGKDSPLSASFDLPADHFLYVHCGLRWRLLTGRWGEPVTRTIRGQTYTYRKPPVRTIEHFLI